MSTVGPDQPIVLCGRLLDADGRSLDGAMVTVITAGVQLGSGATDTTGCFRVTVRAVLPTTVVVAAVGYQPVALVGRTADLGLLELTRENQAAAEPSAAAKPALSATSDIEAVPGPVSGAAASGPPAGTTAPPAAVRFGWHGRRRALAVTGGLAVIAVLAGLVLSGSFDSRPADPRRAGAPAAGSGTTPDTFGRSGTAGPDATAGTGATAPDGAPGMGNRGTALDGFGTTTEADLLIAPGQWSVRPSATDVGFSDGRLFLTQTGPTRVQMQNTDSVGASATYALRSYLSLLEPGCDVEFTLPSVGGRSLVVDLRRDRLIVAQVDSARRDVLTDDPLPDQDHHALLLAVIGRALRVQVDGTIRQSSDVGGPVPPGPVGLTLARGLPAVTGPFVDDLVLLSPSTAPLKPAAAG